MANGKLEILADISPSSNSGRTAQVHKDGAEKGTSETVVISGALRMSKGRVLLLQGKDVYDVVRIGSGVNSKLSGIPTLDRLILSDPVEMPGGERVALARIVYL